MGLRIINLYETSRGLFRTEEEALRHRNRVDDDNGFGRVREEVLIRPVLLNEETGDMFELKCVPSYLIKGTNPNLKDHIPDLDYEPEW